MAVVGTATVVISADARDWAKQIENQLNRLAKTGDQIGKKIGQNMRKGIMDGLGDADKLFSGIKDSDATKKGATIGDKFGIAFSTRARVHINALFRDMNATAFGKKLATEASMGFKALDFDTTVEREFGSIGRKAMANGATAAGAWETGWNSNKPDVSADIDSNGGQAHRAGRRSGNAFMRGFNSEMKGDKGAPFEGMISGLIDNIMELQVTQGVFAGVAAAISSVGSAIVAAGSAAISAAPAMLKYANVLMAVGHAAVVAKTLFGGVGEAIKATEKAQKASNKTSKQTQKNQFAEEERTLRLKEAKDALNDAIIDGARKNEDAAEAVADSQEDVADAIDAERKAQEQVARAREEAADALADLQLELDRAALSEEKAVLALKKAEKDLAEARAGGNANAIYEADLAYREQLQTLRELEAKNAELREEADKAMQAGVEGSPDVIAAQEDLTDATEGVTDAQRDLARTQEDQARIAHDVALAIDRARLSLKKAKAEAETPIDPAGAAAFDELGDAMSKLHPEAQEFVRIWTQKVLPLFREIRMAGQGAFFDDFNQAVLTLVDNTRWVQVITDAYVGMADALGDFSLKLAEAFVVPETLEAFNNILQSNITIFRNLGDAAVNLVQPLTYIFEATIPYAEAWSESVEKATGKFEDFIATAKDDGSLDEFFERAAAAASVLWEILKDLGRGLGGVFEAALPAGQHFFNVIGPKIEAWANLMQTDEKQNAMAETFMGATNNVLALLDVLTAVGGVLFRMGANPQLFELFKAIEGVIPAFEDLATAAMDQVLPAITRIIEVIPTFGEFFTQTGAVESFMEALATGIEWVAGLLETLMQSPFIMNIIGILGDISGKFMAISLALSLVGKGVGKLKGLYDKVVGVGTAAKKAARSFGDLASMITRNVVGAFKGLGQIKMPFSKKSTKKGFWKTQRGHAKGKKEDRKVKQAGKDMEREVKRQAKGIQDAWDKEAIKLKRQMEAIGEDTIEGFLVGIKKMAFKVKDVSIETAEIVEDSWRRKTETNSPSRMMERIAEDVVNGYVNEARRSKDELARASSEQAETIDNTLDRKLELTGTDAANEVGNDMASTLRTQKPEVDAAARELGNSAGDALKLSSGTGGTQAANRMSEAFEDNLESVGEKAEIKTAAASMGTAASNSLENTASAGGKIAAEKMSEKFEDNLESVGEKAEIKTAAASMGTAASTSLTTSSSAGGKLAAEGMAEAYQKNLKSVGEKVEVKTAATSLGASASSSLLTASTVGGTTAGEAMAESMQASIRKNHDELRRAGTNAALQVQAGANLVDVEIDVDVDTDLDRGGRKGRKGKKGKGVDGDGVVTRKSKGLFGKTRTWVDGEEVADDLLDGKGAKKAAGKVGKEVGEEALEATGKAVAKKGAKKGMGKALTAGLAALPVPGARIAAGAVAAVSAGMTVKSMIENVDTSMQGALENMGMSAEKATETLSVMQTSAVEGLTAAGISAEDIDVAMQNAADGSKTVRDSLLEMGYSTEEVDAAIATMNENVQTGLENTGMSSEEAQKTVDASYAAAEASQGNWWDKTQYWWDTTVAPGWDGFWNGIGEGWSGFWDSAFATISTFFSETIPNWWNNTVVPWWHSIWSGLGQGWSDIWNGAWTAITTFFSVTIPNWWNTSVVPAWNEFWNGIGEGWSDLWNDAWDTIKTFFTVTIPNWWNTTVVAEWNEFWNGIGEGWSDLWNDAWDTIKTFFTVTIPNWWNNTVVATWNEFWNGIGEGWSDLWNDAFQGIKDWKADIENWWNNTLVPWWNGIWEKLGSKVSDTWENMKSGFKNFIAKGYNAGVDVVNNYVIKYVNKLPWMKDDPWEEWKKAPTYATGGPVRGPWSAKLDNVAARLTPGEYVLNKKMVREAGGMRNLERWRHAGPARGGGDSSMKEEESRKGLAEIIAMFTGWFMAGAANGVKKAFDWAAGKFPDVEFIQGLNKWIQSSDLSKWAAGQDKERKKYEEEQEGAGGTVSPYTGPPGGWTYPLPQRFSPGTYPGHRAPGAVDLGAPKGMKIFAVSAGKVIVSVDKTSSYGKHVKLSHSTGEYSLYAHMNKRNVKVGDIVKTGQVIGWVNSTGNSTGNHLHFELGASNTIAAMRKHGVKMAQGGIVSPSAGGMLALLAEAGRSEKVTPLDNQGRSAAEVEIIDLLKQMAAREMGQQINVFPAPGMNERELAIKTGRELAFVHRRRA